MKYFVGTELGVANFLNRNFDWIANALWYEEIPHARDPTKAMFFLGGKTRQQYISQLRRLSISARTALSSRASAQG